RRRRRAPAVGTGRSGGRAREAGTLVLVLEPGLLARGRADRSRCGAPVGGGAATARAGAAREGAGRLLAGGAVGAERHSVPAGAAALGRALLVCGRPARVRGASARR